MDAAQRRRQEAEERARQEARRLVAARAEKVRQEEAERAERARLEESAPRVLVLKETAEGALAGWRLEEARQAAEAWLGLEPEAERPVEVLARVAYLEELGLGGLRRTPSGLVIAGPETLAELLGMPEPPPRVWWERAEIELCLVPAGAFPMGSAEGDKAAASDEKPQHEVGLDAFYLCRTPVTQAQYARFVQGTGHRVPSMEVGWEKPYNWDPKRKAPPEGRSHQPVVLVSWGDAAAYCAWAGLRLPTEAEWEKAVSWDAVGGRKRAYPWGDEWDSRRCNSAERIAGRPLPTYDEWKKWWDGWQKLDVAKRSQDTTTPVGAFSPGGDSPCGCADMAGNVWEWCADWYGATYYPRSAAHNPRGPETGEYRVLRGGSWANLSYDVRSANRIGNLPDYRSYYIGFRCVSSSTSSP
jgi:formylglycine-generating enzyme required for sulfatase activity